MTTALIPTTSHVLRGLAATCLLAVALNACGGGDAQQTASSDAADPAGSAPVSEAVRNTETSSADVCALLTPDEVTAALGAKVGPGEAFTPPGPIRNNTCTWSSDTTPPRTFTLGVTTDADIDESLRKNGQTAAALFTATKNGYTSGLVPVAGVGDEAYRFGGRVFVRRGTAFLSATTGLGDSAEAISALETLTKSAVAKL